MVSRKFIKNQSLISGTLFFSLIALATPAVANTVNASYLYSLSDFTGSANYNGGTIFVDQERNEAYVLYQNTVRLYNSSGLEVYQFGDNKNLGMIRGLAVDQYGSILLLSYSESGEKYEIILCNFRGDPKEKIQITGLPAGFNAFRPDRLAYWQGDIYLADSNSLLVAIIDMKGNVKRSLDLFALLEVTEKDKEDAEMDGFSVDKVGNMLFTLPMKFTACRVSPDGTVASFGRPGSIPGKFGIVSAIIADNQGNILVADKLKCSISVFDKNFKFLLEFGYRGNGPDNLIAPQGMAIDSNDRVYVVQAANRGVSVFRMLYSN